jgi:hypothetical protein
LSWDPNSEESNGGKNILTSLAGIMDRSEIGVAMAEWQFISFRVRLNSNDSSTSASFQFSTLLLTFSTTSARRSSQSTHRQIKLYSLQDEALPHHRRHIRLLYHQLRIASLPSHFQ